MCRDTWKVIQSLQLLVSHQVRPYSSVRTLCGLSYTSFTYPCIGAIWWNWAQIPQIICRDTWKVIQSLQLLVSHQMRPYSSVRALSGSSYTCFTGTQVLGQFGEFGAGYPKSRAGTNEKYFKVFRSLFYIKWDLTLVSRPFCGVSYTCFTGTQVLGQFRETWPEYPKSCTGTHKR